jgi:hypothetical protein
VLAQGDDLTESFAVLDAPTEAIAVGGPVAGTVEEGEGDLDVGRMVLLAAAAVGALVLLVLGMRAAADGGLDGTPDWFPTTTVTTVPTTTATTAPPPPTTAPPPPPDEGNGNGNGNGRGHGRGHDDD